MEKEITLTITVSSKDYTIALEDEEFVRVLERDLDGFKGRRKALSTEELLYAYVKKCYDSYTDECKMKEIIENIDLNLTNKRIKR